MLILYVLIGVIIFSFALKPIIKRVPLVFYALALVLVVLFLARGVISVPVFVDKLIFVVMQKAHLAFAFFVVVMFIGVFSEKSKVRIWLQPIRAELSILACILTIGHIVAYLVSIGTRILSNLAIFDFNIVSSFFLSILLTALLILLGVTSFRFLKKRMNTRIWQRIQWLAYPFFLLTWLHILLYLMPAALTGSLTPLINIIVYSVLFLAYIVLRLLAAYRNRQNSLATQNTE